MKASEFSLFDNTERKESQTGFAHSILQTEIVKFSEITVQSVIHSSGILQVKSELSESLRQAGL